MIGRHFYVAGAFKKFARVQTSRRQSLHFWSICDVMIFMYLSSSISSARLSRVAVNEVCVGAVWEGDEGLDGVVKAPSAADVSTDALWEPSCRISNTSLQQSFETLH